MTARAESREPSAESTQNLRGLRLARKFAGSLGVAGAVTLRVAESRILSPADLACLLIARGPEWYRLTLAGVNTTLAMDTLGTLRALGTDPAAGAGAAAPWTAFAGGAEQAAPLAALRGPTLRARVRRAERRARGGPRGVLRLRHRGGPPR